MKKLLLFFAFFAVCSIAMAQNNQKAPNSQPSGPVISFEENTFDFGTLAHGEKAEKIFTFTNTGTEPLIVFNIQTTCGCTAPFWTKEPVMPGESGEVKLVFNSAGKNGVITRSVSVQTNSVAKPSFSLKVKGTVTKTSPTKS